VIWELSAREHGRLKRGTVGAEGIDLPTRDRLNDVLNVDGVRRRI
jgi:hypothetical protein